MREVDPVRPSVGGSHTGMFCAETRCCEGERYGEDCFIKLYIKIWVLNQNALPLHPRLSYGVMVALQFLVLSVVVRIRLGQQQGIRRSNKEPRIFRLELYPEIQHL